MKKILRKLKSRSAETLIETLVAVLIIALTFVGLVTSVVTSSEINHKAQTQSNDFSMENSTTQASTVKITGLSSGVSEDTTVQVDIKETKDGNGNSQYSYYGNEGEGTATEKFKITYLDSEGGAEYATRNVSKDYYAENITPPAAQRGYSFNSWYDSETKAPYDFSLQVETNKTLFATWNKETIYYTATFAWNWDDGAHVSPYAVKNVEDTTPIMTKPEVDPNREGYTFGGWALDTAGNNLWNFETDQVTDDITLYAKWTPITYQVEFDPNDGEAITMPPQSFQYDQEQNLTPNTYDRGKGFTFEGWATSSDGAPVYKDGEAVKNLTSVNGRTVKLYACWGIVVHKVEFKADELPAEEVPESQEIEHGGKVDQPDDPKLHGTVFAGWYTSKTFEEGTLWNFANDVVVDDMTLYAKFVGNSYRIIYKPNGATSGTTTYSVHQIHDNSKLNKNTFERSYSITLNGNGGSSSSITSTYTFTGWNTQADGKGTSYKDEDVIKDSITGISGAEITLYAQWEGNPQELPDSTWEGRIFQGWYYEKDGDHKVEKPSKFVADCNDTYFAHWDEIETTINYEVSEECVGKGTVDPATEKVMSFTGVAKGSTAKAVDGWHFVKWVDQNGETVGTNAHYVPSKTDAEYYVDATYYAVFAEDTVLIKYLSSDSKMGSTKPNIEEVTLTGTAGGSVAEANSGYYFVNWTDKDGKVVSEKEEFKPSKDNKVNVGAVYYANFAEKTVTITYYSEDEDFGTVSPDKETVFLTGDAKGATATAKPGYEFVKWTNKAGNEVSKSAYFAPSRDKVSGWNVEERYTAHFKEKADVTITYTVNNPSAGSVAPESESVAPVSGNAQGAEATANKGYHFVNWTDENGVEVFTGSKYVPTKATGGAYVAATYTANFAENENVTISYIVSDVNAGTVSPTSESVAPVTGTASGSTATAKAGYHFVGWVDSTGKSVGTNPLYRPGKEGGLYSSVTYKAVFEEDPAIMINYETEDSNFGSVSPTSESLKPVSGEAQGATATANDGYHFSNWTNKATGEVVSRDEHLVPEKANGFNVAATYVAHFILSEVTFNYTVQTAGTGSVTKETETFDPSVTNPEGATAIPAVGYEFDKWVNASGETVSTSATYVPQKNAKGLYVGGTFTAVFKEGNVTITYVSNNEAYGTVKPGSETIKYTENPKGATATAKDGCVFVCWKNEHGNDVGRELTYKPSIETGHNIKATYTANFAKYVNINWDLNSSQIPTIYLIGLDISIDSDQTTKVMGGYQLSYSMNKLPIATAQGKLSSKNYYVFAGWFTEKDGGQQVSLSTVVPESNVTYYAHWVWDYSSYYTVHFMDGDTSLYSQVVDKGETVSRPIENPTKDGYTFVGWYTAKTGGKLWDFENNTITENTKIYAHWSENTYSITYNSNGGTGSMSSTNFKYGEEITLESCGFTKEDYAFTGWNTKADGTGGDYAQNEKFKAYGNMTLYAQWKYNVYTVSFDANYGYGSIDPMKCIVDSSITLPDGSALSLDGYTLTSWNTKPDGTGVTYALGGSFKPSKDTTLYAIWAQNVTITYDGNGSTAGAVDAQAAYIGKTIVAQPNGFERTYYEFTGWNTDPNGAGDAYAAGSSIKVTGNLTLYAQWRITVYFITYDGNGGEGTIDQVICPIGSSITLSKNEYSRTGYTFNGWNNDKNGQGTPYKVSDTITPVSDMTIYAQWNANIYDVTLYPNEGTIAEGHNVTSYTYGVGKNLPDASFITRTGHTFEGWYTDSGCTQGPVTAITREDIGKKVFYAKWSTNVYGIMLNTNGGTIATGADVPDYSSYTYGIGASLPTSATISRPGYEFAGWYVNENLSGDSVTAIGTTETGRKEFWAKWNALTYDITYETYGGEIQDPVTQYTCGTGATLPTNVTLDGRTFVGWYADAAYSNAPITAIGETEYDNKTFYAKWENNTYTVTLHNNEGAIVPGYEVTGYTYGDVKDLPTKETILRTGYAFNGWYTNENFTGAPVTTITATDYGNKEFWAKWTVCTYPVELVPNGGKIAEGKNVTSYTYGVGAELPNGKQMTLFEHSFGGWYANEDFTGDPVTEISKTDTGEKKLYAKWDINVYEVKLVTNGGTIAETYGAVENVIYYAYGTETALPTADKITKTENEFKGWYDNAACTGNPVTSITATDTGEKTFWAKWKANTYQINYELFGGSFNKTVVTSYTYGEGATLPTKNDVTKRGHTFKSWHDNSECTGDVYTALSVTQAKDVTLYAKWEPNVYDVTYETNEGTIANASNYAKYTFGKGLTLPTATEITREGYTFLGWYEKSDFSGDVVTAIGNDEIDGKKFYAKWALSLTIEYDANGGAGTITTWDTYVGDVVTIPGASVSDTEGFTRDYYEFSGWNTSATGNGTGYEAGQEVTMKNNLKLYAQWTPCTYGISYESNGGTIEDSVEKYTYGVETKLPEKVTKTGHTFKGWYDNAGFTGNVYTSIAAGTHETQTFYAKWEANTYDVVYEIDANTTIANAESFSKYTYGIGLTLPTDKQISKDGYTFLGWYKKSDFSGDVVTEITKTDIEKQTFYPKWAQNCTITYSANHGTTPKTTSQLTYVGATVNAQNNGFTRNYYKFVSWNTSADGKGATYKPGDPIENIKGNMTLYACWEMTHYVVTYKPNGGSGDKYYTVTPVGESLTVLENKFTRTGYKFVKWNPKANGEYKNSYYPGNVIKYTKDFSLYAQWEVETYKVTLNTNGGTINNGNVTEYTYGKGATLPTDPKDVTKENYKFDGWYDNSECKGTAVTLISTTSTEDKAFWAKWTPLTYKINYELDGGTINSGKVESYVYGKGATLPTDVKKTGYTFQGWYANAELTGNAVTTVSAADSGDKTFYAKWSKDVYTITYNTNEGTISGTPTTEYSYGDTVTLPEVKRDHYTFGGWYRSATFVGSSVTTISGTETGNQEFWAKWTAKSYSITYEPNGGSMPAEYPTSYNYGEGATLPSAVTKSNYTFDGWYANEKLTGNKVEVLTATDSGNKKFYAKWIPVSFRITYVIDGATIEGLGPDAYAYGTETALSGYEAPFGYSFDGWYRNADLSDKIVKTSTTDAVDLTVYGHLNPLAYNVNFNGNGASSGSMNPQTFAYNESKALAANAYTKTGYKFMGWSTVVGADVSYNDKENVNNITDPGNTVVLYAVWSPITYTIQFNKGDYGSGDSYTQSFTYDVEQTLLTNKFTSSRTFMGWKDSSGKRYQDGESVINLTDQASTNVVLTAVWTNSSSISKITFSRYNGEDTEPTEGKFTISSWGVWIFAYDYVSYSGNYITIEDGKTLTVQGNGGTFDIAVGSGSSFSPYENQTSYSLNISDYTGINDPTRSGYRFWGWKTTTDADGNVTLSAQWKSGTTYNVTYSKYNGLSSEATAGVIKVVSANDILTVDPNGGAVSCSSSITVKANTSIPDATLSGAKFVGWEVKKIDSTNYSFIAKWQKSYPVTFVTYGGTINSGNISSYVSGIGSDLPTDVTRTGYKFKGWYLDETFETGPIESITIREDGDRTYYANWEPITYTVTLDTMGGRISSDITSFTYQYGDEKDLPTDISKIENDFEGWYDNKNFSGSRVTKIPADAHENKTYYAKWKVHEYNVILEPNEGTYINGGLTKYTYGSGVALPAVKRIGYTFGGWFDNDKFSGNQVTNIPTTANTTLYYYAKWTVNTYSVTLDLNGGGTINTGNVTQYTYGKEETLPTNVTRTDYIFQGWYDNANGTGTAITSVSSTATGNKTYYAKWQHNIAGIVYVPSVVSSSKSINWKYHGSSSNTVVNSQPSEFTAPERGVFDYYYYYCTCDGWTLTYEYRYWSVITYKTSTKTITLTKGSCVKLDDATGKSFVLKYNGTEKSKISY